AEHLRGSCAAVLEVDLDARRIRDDVLVGEDVAVGVIHHAGTLALRRAAATTAATTAERVEALTAAALRLLGDGDVDDAGAGVAIDLVDGEAFARAERSRDRGRVGCWTTVVVTDLVVPPPLAMT